jgi:hypothetical protein
MYAMVCTRLDITHVVGVLSRYMSKLGKEHWIVVMIQVDIGGHPPIPTSSKQFVGNLLFLAVFWFLNFWGHFEGLNDVFS